MCDLEKEVLMSALSPLMMIFEMIILDWSYSLLELETHRDDEKQSDTKDNFESIGIDGLIYNIQANTTRYSY